MQFLTHHQRYRLWRWTATAAAGLLLSTFAYGQNALADDTATNTVNSTSVQNTAQSSQQVTTPSSAQATQPSASSTDTRVKVTPAVGDQGEPEGLKKTANSGGITKPNTKYTEIANSQYGEFGTQTAKTWGNPNDPTIRRATVSNLNQLPLTFVPGQLIYDPDNDTSPRIDSQQGLTEVQMNFLRELDVNWLNQYRSYVYDHYPEIYQYYNRLGGYTSASGMDNIWPFTLLNTDVAASIGDQEARMRANDKMDAVQHDLTNPDIWRIVQNTTHSDALQQAILNNLVADGAIRSKDDIYLYPDNNENLYIVSGTTLLQYAIDLYNRMQAMLYGELNDPGVTTTTQLGHAINALRFADLLTGIGFQRSAQHPMTYYVTFDSQSFSPYVSASLSSEAQAWYKTRGITLNSAYLRDKINAMITSGRLSQYLGKEVTSAEYNTIVDAQTIGVHVGWDWRNGNWYYYNQYGDIMTGWQLIKGSWYYMDLTSGIMATGLTTVNGQLYDMSSGGQMLTGWQYTNGHWYYLAPSGAAESGWQLLRGSWYYLDPSSHQMYTGVHKINGRVYGFNNSGAMLYGWQAINGNWYYFSGSGAANTGWQLIGNQWFYFDPTTAVMAAGLHNFNGRYYYLNDQHNGSYGAMRTGWQIINGHWYGFDNSGAAWTGWRLINGRWYYFNDQGRADTGLQMINGRHYYFDQSNAWALTGWQKLSNHWYYFDSANAWADTGWRFINGRWYYFNDQGQADTGLQTINGLRYYFDQDNAWALTGWQKLSNHWYYFDPANAWADIGWQFINGRWYYFNDQGQALSGWQTINGHRYYFDPSNAWALTGWQTFNGHWYYFDQNNAWALTGWQTIGNHRYYFDANGQMATGTQVINHVRYTFDSRHDGYYGSLLSSTPVRTNNDGDAVAPAEDQETTN